jgi:hypothetical protein
MLCAYRMQGVPHIETSPYVELKVSHLVFLSTGATFLIGAHSLRLKIVHFGEVPYQVPPDVPVHQVLHMVFLKTAPDPFAAKRGSEVEDHQSHVDLGGHLLHGGVCHQITRTVVNPHLQKQRSLFVLLHCLVVSSEIACEDLCQRWLPVVLTEAEVEDLDPEVKALVNQGAISHDDYYK